MNDEIKVLLAYVTVGREVSMLVLLARSEDELHIVWEPRLSHSPLCERTSPEYERRRARSAQLHEGSTVDLSQARDVLDTPFSPVAPNAQEFLHSWPDLLRTKA